MHYEETKYGFDWGAAKVTRGFSDEKKGWVSFLLETPKHKDGKSLQIYVTRTGKVRIYDAHGEWKAPNHDQVGFRTDKNSEESNEKRSKKVETCLKEN